MPVSSPSISEPTPAVKADNSHGVDLYIWGSYIGLVLVSIIELFSASSQEITGGNIYGPILRHAMFLAIGAVIMLWLERMHFARFYYLIPIFVIASMAMMIWVLVAGVNVNGVRRAIEIGGIMILPAEFLKLSVCLGIAWILSRSQVKLPDGRHDVDNVGLALAALLVLASSALTFNQGLTNTLLLMSISISMMLVGGVSWRKLGIVFLVYVVLGGTAMLVKHVSAKSSGPTPEDIELAAINGEDVVSTSDKGNRINTWIPRLERHFRLNKSSDSITDENKQEQLSYIAQAHGGLRGVGPGNSRENARLPLAFSDYIFAIVVEEFGAIFSIGVMALYLFLLGRAGRLTMTFKSTFPTLLVIGCAMVICLQALFHICIVVGVFPVSGQPLPLISKGGTSVIATSMALGVMLSASRWAARKSDTDEVARAELSSLPDDIANSNPSQI